MEKETYRYCKHCNKEISILDLAHWRIWDRTDTNTLKYICKPNQAKISKHYIDHKGGREKAAAYHKKRKALGYSSKGNHYKSRYGITKDDVDLMIQNQGGVCDICESQLMKFHVDHCHETGKVRGLLCPLCNKGLGLFKDSSEVLRKASTYLERNYNE